MNKILIIVVLVLIIGGLGTLFIFQNQTGKNELENSTPILNSNSENEKKIAGYSGTLLAGTTTPYLDFNKTDYDKALQDGKTIFLEFYANWCPICRAQEPELFAGFNALTNPNVVGFRVNYNDPNTDETEKQLATENGITYQHTHVILKNGEEVYKSNEQLTQQNVIDLINQYSQ